MYNLFEAKLFLAYSIDTNIIKSSSIYRSIHYKKNKILSYKYNEKIQSDQIHSYNHNHI